MKDFMEKTARFGLQYVNFMASMRRISSLALMFLVAKIGYAQNTQDTLVIKELELFSRKEEKNSGSRISILSSSVLESSLTKSLSEVLSEQTSLSIKRMGRGALSSLSFRGTTANHTQVTWNGISINSPSLGGSDISQIPVFLVDEVIIRHGSSALRSSTGALGGSIDLRNLGTKTRGEIKLLGEIASNKTYTEGLSFRKTYGPITLATRWYKQDSQNDYRYLNTTSLDKPSYERRSNAGYDQEGFLQEIYYDMKRNRELSAAIWVQGSNRNLPSSILYSTTAVEHLNEQNRRSIVTYRDKTDEHDLKLSTAFLAYRSTYRSSYDALLEDFVDKNQNHSWQLSAEYSKQLNAHWSLGMALQYRADDAHGESFLGHRIDKNIFSARWFTSVEPIRQLTLEAQTMVERNDKKHGNTYQIGMKYPIINNKLILKGANSYNYRFPSLNDWYWSPGGNPDLNPEKGFSSEIGLQWNTQIKKIKLDSEATYYHMDIHNWIMWAPLPNSSLWQPQNLTNVRSKGVELSASLSYQFGNSVSKIRGNYHYTSSVERSQSISSTQSQQLPYIPLNKWSGRYSFEYKKLSVSYHAAFTGARRDSSTDQSFSAKSYTTHHAQLGYLFIGKKHHKLKLSLSVDNLLNTSYESTRYYPMPLRSFSLSALWTIH